MKSSGRRNPCPVCGRDKDDKCRWNDEIILCWQGDSFSPPQNLKKGQTLDVPGRGCMAVLGVDVGVGGSSLLLGPHDGRGAAIRWQEEPETIGPWEARAYPVAKKLVNKIAFLQNSPDLELFTMKDFQVFDLTLKLCHSLIHTLDQSMEGLPIKHPKLRQMRRLLLNSRRQLTFISHAYHSFRASNLGESKIRRARLEAPQNS
jgi:hypothetical protein